MTDYTILDSQNEGFGFYGTIDLDDRFEAADAWAVAFQAIMEAVDSPEAHVRLFLDSRMGRHFADTVISAPAAETLEGSVKHAIKTWTTWKIGRLGSRRLGIPARENCLQGHVTHQALFAEQD